ncbi:MAG: kinase-like domain-containing protein [Monoraphidium minutum]|nr:MAG: kinase-like domain-containing protein [Monoraphidium minutum]
MGPARLIKTDLSGSDSGVFEEGGLVLSKAGCVIPGQRPRAAAAAEGAEAQAQHLLLQQQPQLIAAAGGRPPPSDDGADLFASSDTGFGDPPTLGERQHSPTLQKERRQVWGDQGWLDASDEGQPQQERRPAEQQQQRRQPGGTPPAGAQPAARPQSSPSRGLGQQQQQQQQEESGGRIALEDLDELGIVGSGSSGVVKKVRHQPSGEVLVLKVIQFDVNNETLRKQARARARVTTELRSLAGSRHPHVVSYRQSYLANGAVTILMEYMDCGSLADLLARAPRLPERLLAEVARQVVAGLAYLHGELRIRRDIKPSNLLLTTGRAAARAAAARAAKAGAAAGAAAAAAVAGGGGGAALKISDFGVSGQLSSSVSKCASWVGTVTYMSPERIRGDAYSFNTDVWSLGMVLVEAATGRFPYPPPGEGGAPPGGLGFWELLEYIVVEPAPRLPGAQFSPECCGFVHACLTKDPAARASAAELLSHPWLRRQPPADLGALLARAARASVGASGGGGALAGGGGGPAGGGAKAAAAAAAAPRAGAGAAGPGPGPAPSRMLPQAAAGAAAACGLGVRGGAGVAAAVTANLRGRSGGGGSPGLGAAMAAGGAEGGAPRARGGQGRAL